MKLYLSTPLSNFSKYLPHLVEHCVWHSVLDPNHYFDFSYGLDGVVTPEYTCFEYDKWVSYEEAIDMIVAPLDKEAFIYETAVLKQELENSFLWSENLWSCFEKAFKVSYFT